MSLGLVSALRHLRLFEPELGRESSPVESIGRAVEVLRLEAALEARLSPMSGMTGQRISGPGAISPPPTGLGAGPFGTGLEINPQGWPFGTIQTRGGYNIYSGAEDGLSVFGPGQSFGEPPWMQGASLFGQSILGDGSRLFMDQLANELNVVNGADRATVSGCGTPSPSIAPLAQDGSSWLASQLASNPCGGASLGTPDWQSAFQSAAGNAVAPMCSCVGAMRNALIPGVFVLGDLVQFGGGTVRAGFQDMLNVANGVKDEAGERTHSIISPEAAQRVRELLASNDPTVKATLDTAIPTGKSFVIGQDGKLLETLDTANSVTNNASLDMADHVAHVNDPGTNWDRSAGGYVDSGSSNPYQVLGTVLHSPIKIALDGKNAQLDSSHGFQIALDGFGAKGDVATTSGGLNTNEAWLVRDKDGQGVVKNGVVNGNDVYGDHNGKFQDGYQELARDYASEVKQDPKTGAYIDLTDPSSRAAKQLQLLDAQGKLTPAASVLKRIDLTEQKTAEADAKGQNAIKERANVTYRDGHTASSADQWFATAPAKTATPSTQATAAKPATPPTQATTAAAAKPATPATTAAPQAPATASKPK